MVDVNYDISATIVVFSNPREPTNPLPPTYNYDLYIRRQSPGEPPATQPRQPNSTSLLTGLSDNDENVLSKIAKLASSLVDVLCKAESFAKQINANVSSSSNFPELPESTLKAVQQEFEFYSELYTSDQTYHRDPLMQKREHTAYKIMTVNTGNLVSGKTMTPITPQEQDATTTALIGTDPVLRPMPERLASISEKLRICQDLLSHDKFEDYVKLAREILAEADVLAVDCEIGSQVTSRAIKAINQGGINYNPLTESYREYYDHTFANRENLVHRYNEVRKYVWRLEEHL